MKRKLSIIMIICMILTLLPTSLSFADTAGIKIESIDTEGSVGSHNSLAINTDGNPCISYHDANNSDLKYAYYDGEKWHTETVDSTGDVGNYTSLAIKPDGNGKGNPCISYYEYISYDKGNLKYAYYDGKDWHIETVDSTGNTGKYTSLAIKPDGNPCISYKNINSMDLKYAYYDGKDWHAETVDSAGWVGDYTSLAIKPDGNGNPCISYRDSSNGLKYAYYDGEKWHKEIVDSFGSYTSLAIKPDGNPCMSYYDTSNNELKYAYNDGIDWHTEPVDSTFTKGGYTSLAIDGKGNPCISYGNRSILKYACRVGRSWCIGTVDTFGNASTDLYNSLAINSEGNPCIGYFDARINIWDLKYASLYLDNIEMDYSPVTFNTIKEWEVDIKTVTITNRGVIGLRINDIRSSSNQFSYLEDFTDITGTVIGQGETKTFDVVFHPDKPGNHIGTIEVDVSNPHGNEIVNVSVSGIATYSERNWDLKSLDISEGVLDKDFNPHEVVYEVTGGGDLKDITITAETLNPLSTITINDNPCRTGSAIETVDLHQGSNLIPITVTSEDNTNQKSYVLSVNGKVSNAYLDSLTVSKGMLDFDKDDFIYDVNVGNDTETLDITATPNDNKALVLIDGNVRTGGAIQTVDLKVGENPIEVMVVAQNASTKTYTLNVNRGIGNLNLSNIHLSHGEIEYDESITIYNVDVDYQVDTITITPTAIDSEATVTVNGNSNLNQPIPLQVGDNKLTIEVTGKEGIGNKQYEMNIKRKEKLIINNNSLPIGIVGTTYSAILTAEGGTPPYEWAATGLPTELNLNKTTGEIIGKLTNEGNYTVDVTVKDKDGNEITKNDISLKINLGCGNGGYIISPLQDSDYTGGFTEDGIPIMTINEGVIGFKYFSVNITPVNGHTGDEVAIFVHMRNGKQIGIMGYKADFDEGKSVQACLNVQEGDIIKVFIVDRLSNTPDDNPNVL